MKKVFLVVIVLFFSSMMYSFTTPKTIHSKTNKVIKPFVSTQSEHHYVFNNTYIGTFDGCRVYFTGTITFCDDGTYFFQDGCYVDIDCRPRIYIVARINEDRTMVISSTYKSEKELSNDESAIMDRLLLVLVQTLE